MPTPSTPPPTSPMVGPSSRTHARERRAARHDGHAAGRHAVHDDRARTLRRAADRAAGSRTAPGPAPARRTAADRRPRPGNSRRAASATIASQKLVRHVVVVGRDPAVLHDHEKGLEHVAVLIADVLLRGSGTDRRTAPRRRPTPPGPPGGADRGRASTRRCGPSSRGTARPARRASTPGTRRGRARSASRGCGTSAAQTSAAL